MILRGPLPPLGDRHNSLVCRTTLDRCSQSGLALAGRRKERRLVLVALGMTGTAVINLQDIRSS